MQRAADAGTALAGMLGLVVLTGFSAGAARAQSSDPDSIWNLDKKIMDNVMHGLGLKNGSEEEIEYRERSPLVVPPSRDLPPPQSAIRARDPDWPVDPDVARRQNAKNHSGIPMSPTIPTRPSAGRCARASSAAAPGQRQAR